MIVDNNTLKEFDWATAGKGILGNYSFSSNVTRTPIVCKDGTTDFSLSSSNSRYDNSKVCANNGGIAETFFKVVCNDGTTQNVSNQPKEGVSNLACTKNGGVSKNKIIENQIIAVKPTSEQVKQQSILAPVEFKLTAEDKLYEMLGIRYSGGSGSGWGLTSRPVGRTLVAVILVAGYFAYRKFKK